jgi:hypothetical protein
VLTRYTAVEPAELSDDMISQESPDEVPRNARRPGTHRLRKPKNTRSSTQDLTVFGYRMPVARSNSRMTTLRSVSDGFVGKEAYAIGKLMKVKEPLRLRQSSINLTPKMSSLTLVEAKSDDDLGRGQQISKPTIIKSQAFAVVNNDTSSLSELSAFDRLHFSGSDHSQLEREMDLCGRNPGFSFRTLLACSEFPRSRGEKLGNLCIGVLIKSCWYNY